MITVLILSLSILIASALCSIAEAAILSLPLVRARILCEENRKNSKDLLYLKENIPIVIGLIVIFNNTINIVGSIYVGRLVGLRFGDEWLGVVSGILTFCIIIFSEIIPKTIGERYKISLSLIFAKPIRLLLWIFRPFVELILKMTHPFMPSPRYPKITEDEIKMMLKLARDVGTVEMDEELLCSRVFKLNDVQAAQIMHPIEQTYALSAYKTLGELKQEILDCRYSRIGVYEKDRADIVGTVQLDILLREIAKGNYNLKIKDLMTPSIYVLWFTKADALLEKFQAYQQHLFIVLDSHKRKIGIVTMEDALEELFGEIYDEKDAAKYKLKKK